MRHRIKDRTDHLVLFLRKHKLLVLGFLVLLSVMSYNYLSGGLLFSIVNQDMDALTDFIRSFGGLASLVFFLLVLIEVVIAPVPSLFIYVAGGLLFGTLWGGTIAFVANLLGSYIGFVLARTYMRGFVENALSKRKLIAFDRVSDKYGGYAVFLLRINPLTSTDLISYFAGLSNISLKDFMLGTFFGLLPLIFIQSYMGAGLIKNNPFLTLLFIFVAVIYAVLFLYTVYQTRKSYVRNRKDQ